MSKKRTLSRLVAVQVLYNYHFVSETFLDEGDALLLIKNEILDEYSLDGEQESSSYQEKVDHVFLDNLLNGAFVTVNQIDQIISKFLKGSWTIKKIDRVIIEILRLGVFELKFMKDVPASVAVDEYVSIAASFFCGKEITFVNALLDNVRRELQIQSEVPESQNQSSQTQ